MYGWNVKLKEIPKLLFAVIKDTGSHAIRSIFKK